ncbi:CHAD domain-containing protein [Amycolatopsis alkalitolerans]|uniref:CHAD domain-containing protein n=1 Tax=Amycolatopsis alkalitolerans TaxID=2547244 RepID=A0A5C4LS03_9PSEU|nr:CHAD domain-containing protein [Amycolatopsis alkalitolerans]TNC18900.1 CHAD domain-containing protein [Amycolatopsis alkalitolerans]
MPIDVTLRWRGSPTRAEPAELERALAPVAEQYKIMLGPRRVRTASYLDTVDWRLRRRGLVLTHEGASGPGSLVLDADAVKLTEPPAWPARVEALPGGAVREAVADAMWVRAIAPKVRSRTTFREIVLCDPEGEEAVRIEWAEATAVHPIRTGPLVRVTVSPAEGRRRDGKWVVRALRETGEFEPLGHTLYEDLLDACGLPGERSRFEITPGMPADVAIATALLGFADAIMANVDGTIDDIDPEFLHQLRVGVRRTRSLLKIAGDVLLGDLAGRYAGRFKELGDLTTPSRDLDVYLLEFDGLAQGLTAGGGDDLAPFKAHLERHQAAARKALVRGLRGQRFARAMESWRAALTGVVESGGAKTTVDELAVDRLRRLTKRVTRRAKAITPESPAAGVHDLRKRCKELRYGLEVFQPVCEPVTHRGVLKDLKRLQDVLGAFQDGEVQSQTLRAYAQEMVDEGPPPAAALLAMGELLAGFVDHENEARHDLTAAVSAFVAKSGRFTGLVR